MAIGALAALGTVLGAAGQGGQRRAGVINTGIGLWQAKENREATFRENERSRAWEQGQYIQSRNDKRDDRDFENAYSHPTQQMARLKEAGLNPRLMYNNGTGIMSSAHTASSSPNSPKTQAPQYDMSGAQRGIEQIGGTLGKFAEIAKLGAETSNALATKHLIEANTAATLAGIPKTESETETSVYNLNWLKKTENRRNELLSVGIEKIKEEIENIQSSSQKNYVQAQVELDNRDVNQLRIILDQAKFQLDKRVKAQEILNLIADRMKIQAETGNLGEQRTILIQQSEVLRHETTIKALESYMKGKELDYYELNMFLKAAGIGVGAYVGAKGVSIKEKQLLDKPRQGLYRRQKNYK